MLLPLKVHIYLLLEEPINEEHRGICIRFARGYEASILQQPVAKLSEQALLAVILCVLI